MRAGTRGAARREPRSGLFDIVKKDGPGCDGDHIARRATHLPSGTILIPGGCDMIAECIVIYVVMFILCAAVVGVPKPG
jgi:hypothetical protein